MESIDDVLPPEKIAFIAYNIGVYESVQKFGGLITSGKIAMKCQSMSLLFITLPRFRNSYSLNKAIF